MKKSNNKTSTDVTAGSGKDELSAKNTAPRKRAKQKDAEAAEQVPKSDATDQGKSDLIEQLSETPIESVDEPQKVRPKKELREQFRDSHKSILDQIINETSPKGDIDITKEIGVSKIALDDYVTLDWQHYEEIQKLLKVILDYTKDSTKRRPLNVIMQAEPGSGKSHFIKSIARRMASDGVSAVTFNMASLESVDDFIQPLEEVRNVKVVDKIPLLFLDEFDSDPKNYSLLLPLLWDGELSVGQRRLRIGKVVTVLAGSGRAIGATMKNAKSMRPETDDNVGKLPDLLSRINGGELTIPNLDEVSSARDRRVDKVCLTIALLAQRFDSLHSVPWAFLKFVAETKFRYGVRSISHLIDLIPSQAADKVSLAIGDLQLPLSNPKALKASSLAFHLVAEDGPAAIIESWKAAKANDVLVRFAKNAFMFNIGKLLEKLVLPIVAA
jgi:DNA replication protein DnaC